MKSIFWEMKKKQQSMFAMTFPGQMKTDLEVIGKSHKPQILIEQTCKFVKQINCISYSNIYF